jgi:hypothetical protein
MNRIISAVLTASALILGVFLPREESVAQTTAKDLVGPWTLVSIMIEQDSKKTDLLGPNRQGQETRPANGHVSVIITRSDLPKFASNNRAAQLQKKTGPSCRGALPTSAGAR